MTIEAQLKLLDEKLNNIAELMQLSINSLSTRKAVSQFLNKTEKTIDNYIKNNTFIKNKHYIINENGKIEFLPIGIIEFKKIPNYKIKVEDKINIQNDKPLKLSEVSSRILKDILWALLNLFMMM